MFNRLRNKTVRDDSFQRLIENALHLLGGSAAQSALSLVSTLIVARYLGAREFGILSLVASYALIMNQLIGFQSTYVSIKFGVKAKEHKGVVGLLGVIKAGAVIDFVSACLSTVVATVGLRLANQWLNLDTSHLKLALLFCLLNVTNSSGFSTAILRIQNRYKAFLLHGAVAGLCRLVLTITAWKLDEGLLGVGVAWVLSEAVANIFLILLGALEFRRLAEATSTNSVSIVETFRTYPDMGRMFLSTNLSATMRMLRDVDVFIVGWLLTPREVGYFRVARQVGALLNKMVDPFYHAIYPDLTRSYERGSKKEFVSLIMNASLITGAISVFVLIAFFVAGAGVFVRVFGLQYKEAYSAAGYCLLGGVVWAFSHPLAPALMACNQQKKLLHITSATSIVYLICVYIGLSMEGVTGGGAAYALFLFLWALSMGLVLLRQLDKQFAINAIR